MKRSGEVKEDTGMEVALLASAVIEMSETINRSRSLTDREARFVERAVRCQLRASGQYAHKRGGWKSDETKLRRMLGEGKRPAQIAVRLKRTTRAVYRRMHLLGLKCGQGSVAQLQAAE